MYIQRVDLYTQVFWIEDVLIHSKFFRLSKYASEACVS